MLLQHKLGLALCTIASLAIGGITIAQAAPLAGTTQAATALENASVVNAPIVKAHASWLYWRHHHHLFNKHHDRHHHHRRHHEDDHR